MIGSFLVVVGLTASYWIWDASSYAYALVLESEWYSKKPSNRAELEEILGLYSTRVIAPRESQWGSRYVLKEGEKMVQYRLLWKAELDVVFDSSDSVVLMFTSYE